MAFTRRYQQNPGVGVISQIEGVVIIDNVQPGAIPELGTGTACCVGEFADCSASLKSDGDGGLTANYQPSLVFGAADAQQKFGAFDPTIGDFAVSGGNGFVDALVGKQFAQLVLAAINLASAKAVRMVRALPTNLSPTNATPAIPMQAATIPASLQFQDSNPYLVRVAGAQQFTGTNAYGTGTDGVLTTSASAATQAFTSAAVAALISQSKITVGDMIVLGCIDSAPVSFTGTFGSAAAGSISISGGTGTVGATIGGTLVTVPWAVSDAATALALLAAINANVVTAALVLATSGGSGIITLTSLLGGTLGNATSLAASGTGVTVSGVSLTGGASSTTLTVDSVSSGAIAVGQVLSGAGITNGTTVVSGSGLSWVVSAAQSVGPVATAGSSSAGSPGVMGSFYGTFRVNAISGSDTLTLEQLDGSSWATQAASALPWRLHVAATADTAAQGQANNPGALYAATKGYTVPARPLSHSILAGTVMQASFPAAAPSASSWNPLAGLAMLVQSGAALDFTPAIQGVNVSYSTALAAQYQLALNSLLAASAPADLIDIVWCSRTGTAIRYALEQHVDTASQQGVGRMAVISPELSVVTVSGNGSATDSVSPGVGATRDERVIYGWPGVQIYVPQAENVSIATAVPGLNTTDGILDVRMDGLIASVLSVLAPERNPGQTAPPVGGSGGVLSVIRGFQRNAPSLDITAYEWLRSQGVEAPHLDSTLGWEIMSGVTSSLENGQTTVFRRRMADFIEDSLSAGLMPFSKLPATQGLIDAAEAQCDAFLLTLLSPNDPSAQRIAGYSVNANQSQVNTPAAFAAGVFVVQVNVKLIPTADFVVLNANIGTNVVISLAVGQGGVTAVPQA